MFRDVPECSGKFHVPGFIDTPSVERLANNNGNPTVCDIYQDKLNHLARQSNLASPEFPVINPRFLFNSLGVFSEFLEFTGFI